MDCSSPGSPVHGVSQAWVGCHFLLQGIFLTQGLNLSHIIVKLLKDKKRILDTARKTMTRWIQASSISWWFFRKHGIQNMEGCHIQNAERKLVRKFIIRKSTFRKWRRGLISLVVQRLRIHLPMQGIQVWSLIQKDSTCHRATKACITTTVPVCHSYWSLHA